MFDLSAFLFASTPAVEELDLEWSLSAGDLDSSSSTTHPDDDLETEVDAVRLESDSYKDDNDEAEAPTNGNGRHLIDSSAPTSESQSSESNSWVDFESDSAPSLPTDPSYDIDPDDVYRYILNGRASTVGDRGGFDHTIPQQNSNESTCYEVSYEEHCRGLVSSSRIALECQGRTRAQSRDNDGFPIGITDEALMISFMQTPSSRTLECLASKRAPPPEHVRSLTRDARIDIGSTPKSCSPTQALPSPSMAPHTVATKNFRWWGHGRRRTCLALLLAWAGSVLSVYTRQSSHFVTLGNPVVIASAAYEPIHQLGLFHIELCYNESSSIGLSGCQVLTLRSNDVSDNTFDVARLFGSLSMILGPFLTIFLSTSVVWETINLRPIGFALLLAYCFQSFTMILFDSDVCQESHCSVGPGCYLSIAAALCWLGSCLATAAMEAHKIRATRARHRRLRRRVKRALRKAQKHVQHTNMKLYQGRKDSLDTTKTDSASSSEMNLEDLEIESAMEIPSIETLDFESNTIGRYEV